MDTSEPPRIKESYVKTYLAKSTLPDGAMKVEVVEIDLTVKVDGLRAATADSTHVASVEEAIDNYRRMQWLSTLSPIWISSAGTYRALKQNKVDPLPPWTQSFRHPVSWPLQQTPWRQ